MSASTPEREVPEARREEVILPPATPSDAAVKSEPREPKPVGLLAYLFLTALTLLTFSPILQSDLFWSEYDEVERSPFKSMENWSEAWELENIRRHDPISVTSYFLEHQVPLPPPALHRSINLLLHLIAALLLLKTLESLKIRGAFASACVFAVHPAVIQTLYWPGYRNEMVGLIFILVSLCFGFRSRNLCTYVVSIILSFIAVLLHPAALAIPGILALAIFFRKRAFHWHDYNRVLPIACIVLFAGVWTHSGQVAGPSTEEELGDLTKAAQNLNFYIRRSLFPLDFELFYKFSEKQNYNAGPANNILPFALFLPFYVLVAFNYRQRWARGLLMGLSSVLLLLIYGISQTGRFIDGNLAKESFALYVALPAIISLVFCSASGFFGRIGTFGRFIWPVGFSLFLLIHTSMTVSHSYALRDSTKVWQSIADQWENSWQPKAALVQSIEASDSHDFDQSDVIRILEKLLEANPKRSEERILLARTYRKAGLSSNALREYRRVLRETQPDNAFLKEAADFFDSRNLRWEANNARDRISSTPTNKEQPKSNNLL